jgi:hypothetical protein
MDKGLLRGGESTSHASGNDIEYTVVETGQNVLIEGDEYHLCKAAMLSDEIHEYVAKTNKEILDDIYTRSSCMVKEGEAHAGDFIICKVAVRDDTKRNRTGKIREIISVIQGENGCKVVDESQYEDEFAKGGEISSTIAPKKERIYGSKNNPKGSSESGESAKSIKFSQSTLDAITNKVEEHNKNHPEKKVTLEIAKAVVRRGMGAYSSTHRPTIKGGKPNSRVAWGLARLNAFLYKAVKGESKSGKYSQDNDLLHELGIKHSQFADGGTIDKRYVAEADFYVNAKNDDQAKKEANEVAKLIDDKYDNKATVNHLYEIYGGIGNSRKVFKDGGSFQPSYPINNAGGYDYKGKAKETAEKVYLLSLPRNVDGTHCGNCFFQQQGICVHKEIMLPVTDRMCCSVWDNSNSERSYNKNLQKDKGSVPEKVKTYPKNDKGGYTYSGEALKTAKKFDLITLPKDIEGTNCANCSWYTPYKEGGFCFRSNIWLPVNARMSCAFWNNLSVKRDWGLLRFDNGGEINSDTYKKWKSLVNMSKGELEKFYNSEEGKKAGLSKGAAQELGISYGRESARWIMKMKDTPVSEWTPEMWKWAKKQISFISRMSFNKGALYDKKGRKTRKHTSLLIWGHNPEKYGEGGEILNENFKRWFGDSKVVDEDGKPLVVYHGGAMDIVEFDERYGGDNTANNEHGAFYFTDKFAVAGDYSRQAYIRLFDGRDDEDFKGWIKTHIGLTSKDIKAIKNDQESWIENNLKVVQAYLKFENPLIIDMNGETMPVAKMQEIIGFAKKQIWFDDAERYFEPEYNQSQIDDYKEEIEKRARENYDLSDDEDISDWQLSEAQNEILDENNIYPEYPNYDGIIVKRTIDNIGDASNIMTDVYIAFEPTQIKLADGSNTTFDGNNPDIRLREGGEVLKGGLSDGMTLHDIAKKHKKPYKDLMAEFKKGVKVESEHTKNIKMAMEIAKDHLFENPKYYTFLEKYIELGSGGTIGENFYIAARELFQRYLVSHGLFLLPNDKFFIRGDMFSVHFIVEQADNGKVYKAEYVVFSSPVYDQSTVQEFLKAIEAESHYLYDKDVDSWDESDDSNWMRLLRSNVDKVANIEDYDFQEKMVAIGDFNINEFDFDFLPMSEFLESIGYMAYNKGGSFSDNFSPEEIQVLIEPYKDDIKTLRYLANRMFWNDFVSAVANVGYKGASELQRFGRAVPVKEDGEKAISYDTINESETEILNFYALSFSNNHNLRIGDILFADMDRAKIYVSENGITSWDYKLVSVSSDDLIGFGSDVYVYSPKIFRDYVGSLKQFWENSK